MRDRPLGVMVSGFDWAWQQTGAGDHAVFVEPKKVLFLDIHGEHALRWTVAIAQSTQSKRFLVQNVSLWRCTYPCEVERLYNGLTTTSEQTLRSSRGQTSGIHRKHWC